MQWERRGLVNTVGEEMILYDDSGEEKASLRRTGFPNEWDGFIRPEGDSIPIGHFSCILTALRNTPVALAEWSTRSR